MAMTTKGAPVLIRSRRRRWRGPLAVAACLALALLAVPASAAAGPSAPKYPVVYNLSAASGVLSNPTAPPARRQRLVLPT